MLSAPHGPKIEENVRADPARGTPLSFLAIIDAGLGRTKQSIEEGKRACELSSFKINNIAAVGLRTNLAIVYAWIGIIAFLGNFPSCLL